MDITDLVTGERIVCDCEVTSKKRVIETLSELLAKGEANCSARPIFDSLIGRERLGSTGLGHGVALPHGRFSQSQFAVGAFIAPISGLFDASSPVPMAAVILGAALITLSLLPKAAFLVASIPPAVLGGAAIAMFGMVAATGIKILQEADIADRRNQLLVAVSIGMGLIPVVRPEFFAHLPLWMGPITHSGIAMAAVSAVCLNLLFNVLGGAERAALSGHVHQH